MKKDGTAAISSHLKCSICQGLIREPVRHVECFHPFCRKCVLRDVEQSRNDKCRHCGALVNVSRLWSEFKPDTSLQCVLEALVVVAKTPPEPLEKTFADWICIKLFLRKGCLPQSFLRRFPAKSFFQAAPEMPLGPLVKLIRKKLEIGTDEYEVFLRRKKSSGGAGTRIGEEMTVGKLAKLTPEKHPVEIFADFGPAMYAMAKEERQNRRRKSVKREMDDSADQPPPAPPNHQDSSTTDNNRPRGGTSSFLSTANLRPATQGTLRPPNRFNLVDLLRTGVLTFRPIPANMAPLIRPTPQFLSEQQNRPFQFPFRPLFSPQIDHRRPPPLPIPTAAASTSKPSRYCPILPKPENGTPQQTPPIFQPPKPPNEPLDLSLPKSRKRSLKHKSYLMTDDEIANKKLSVELKNVLWPPTNETVEVCAVVNMIVSKIERQN